MNFGALHEHHSEDWWWGLRPYCFPACESMETSQGLF